MQTNENHLETLRNSIENKDLIIDAQTKLQDEKKGTIESLKRKISVFANAKNEKTILENKMTELEKKTLKKRIP